MKSGSWEGGFHHSNEKETSTFATYLQSLVSISAS
eukprot:CAMPEP_0196807438 /NCGR_PEP_ID=MMETSP1362-20130617/7429_1 /TAXON_ID=163516 /ORGANISM="Leptocylindrus danicus, Strain CCMP1856" /LENGTH=34 /DNA_ID= /DNA_START= /DNA_END= /DNA_ORIENTATION=